MRNRLSVQVVTAVVAGVLLSVFCVFCAPVAVLAVQYEFVEYDTPVLENLTVLCLNDKNQVLARYHTLSHDMVDIIRWETPERVIFYDQPDVKIKNGFDINNGGDTLGVYKGDDHMVTYGFWDGSGVFHPFLSSEDQIINHTFVMNDLNTACGYGSRPGGRLHACTFSTERYQNLHPEEDDKMSMAFDINNRGEVAGFAGELYYDMRAYYWDAQGSPHNINPPGCRYSEARAINDDGYVLLRTDDPAARMKLWHKDEGYTDIPNPEGHDLTGAYAFNNNKQILAFTYDDRMIINPDGSFTVFKNPPGYRHAWILDMNNHGVVLGAGVNADGDLAVFLWVPIETMTLDFILDYFDRSVKRGTLTGRGSGWLARLRLASMRKLLQSIRVSIEQNQMPAACYLLKIAFHRCNGSSGKPDLVTGSGAAYLAHLINRVRDESGCAE